MSSIAQHNFPIVRWQNAEKYLWNPIHRKVLKNRPEERVRLRIVEFLIEAGWSRYRISTEEVVEGIKADAGLRTDVICYNQEFEPRILVECKAENVSISQKTAEQIARYNRNVGAPYLLLSNGNRDFWYRIDDHRIESLSEVPGLLQLPEEKPARGFDYWKKRGFVGEKAGPKLRRWLEGAMTCFYESNSTATYLQFKKKPADQDISHYYQIWRMDDDVKIALSFMDTPYGGSRIFGILNQKGVNRSVIEINLDLIFEDERPNASIYSEKGTTNVNASRELADAFKDMNVTAYESLPVACGKLFKNG